MRISAQKLISSITNSCGGQMKVCKMEMVLRKKKNKKKMLTITTNDPFKVVT